MVNPDTVSQLADEFIRWAYNPGRVPVLRVFHLATEDERQVAWDVVEGLSIDERWERFSALTGIPVDEAKAYFNDYQDGLYAIAEIEAEIYGERAGEQQ